MMLTRRMSCDGLVVVMLWIIVAIRVGFVVVLCRTMCKPV